MGFPPADSPSPQESRCIARLHGGTERDADLPTWPWCPCWRSSACPGVSEWGFLRAQLGNAALETLRNVGVPNAPYLLRSKLERGVGGDFFITFFNNTISACFY